MKIGSLKEVFLSRARDFFLFDCRVAGMNSETIHAYRHVLSLFISFTGDVQVQDLRPDHVQLYVEHLSDGPNEGDEHASLVISHYAMIQTWVRWITAQKLLTERFSSFVEPPHFTHLSHHNTLAV